MGHGVEVTELFGIGKKYVIKAGERQKLAVIAHKDGTRELYAFEPGSFEKPTAVIQLDAEETRRLAAVLGGTFFDD